MLRQGDPCRGSSASASPRAATSDPTYWTLEHVAAAAPSASEWAGDGDLVPELPSYRWGAGEANTAWAPPGSRPRARAHGRAERCSASSDDSDVLSLARTAERVSTDTIPAFLDLDDEARGEAKGGAKGGAKARGGGPRAKKAEAALSPRQKLVEARRGRLPADAHFELS